MFKIVRLAIMIAFLVIGSLSLVLQAEAKGPGIGVLQIKGVINPVLADYIKRGIEESEKNGDVACIIQMDTPGGLDTSMREIVQAILNAKLPVVVYVSPSGARAASAGVFITMSAHVAAMSTNTAIGAAHPVALGTDGSVQEIPSDMEQKVLNDAAAYVRSIATSRGRNAEWAERAVRESVSATETEALKLNVIDMIAPTLDDLLVRLDGKIITLIDGSTVTINTQNSGLHRTDMNWSEDFLYAISEPNIAYILLAIGSMGIIAEIFSPGLIFPGIIGAISLVLAFLSLGSLPVNWAGVLLILLAFGLFIAEFFTAGFGLLFGGGVVSLIVGSLILFKGGSPLFRVDWWLVAVVIILIGGFVAFAILRIVKTYHRQATTGREDLIGKTAIVKEKLNPEGTALYLGELWTALSNSGSVEPGEEVTINKVEGLRLLVTKKAKE